MVVEVPERHEGVAIRAQPETKTETDRVSAIAKSDSRLVNRQRRQRGPTAIIVRVSPGHPGRAPDVVRHPAPAEPVMPKPAPIMEGSPAPGIVRQPIPAAIAVNPTAAVEIGLPGRI